MQPSAAQLWARPPAPAAAPAQRRAGLAKPAAEQPATILPAAAAAHRQRPEPRAAGPCAGPARRPPAAGAPAWHQQLLRLQCRLGAAHALLLCTGLSSACSPELPLHAQAVALLLLLLLRCC